MQKVTMLNTILLTALVIVFSLNLKESSAKPESFYHIVPMSSSGGFLRFFDTETGKIYLYNSDLRECVSIVQLGEMGKPGYIIK